MVNVTDVTTRSRLLAKATMATPHEGAAAVRIAECRRIQSDALDSANYFIPRTWEPIQEEWDRFDAVERRLDAAVAAGDVETARTAGRDYVAIAKSVGGLARLIERTKEWA